MWVTSLHVAPNAGIQRESGKASEAVSGFSSRIIAVAMVSGEKLERRSQIWAETGKAQPVSQRNTLKSAYAPVVTHANSCPMPFWCNMRASPHNVLDSWHRVTLGYPLNETKLWVSDQPTPQRHQVSPGSQ